MPPSWDNVYTGLFSIRADMTRSRKFANPFYGLLLVAGIAFAMTAMAYGVMAFRDRDLAAKHHGAVVDEHPLMAWMNEHGEKALLSELAALAVFTVGAIATDDFWQRRDKGRKNAEPLMSANRR
jgi:hypothetical protein